MKNFSADIVYDNRRPDFITLRVKGEVSISTLSRVEKQLESIFPACGGKKVVLDLTEAPFVSSSGWSLILIANKRIQQAKGEMALAGMNAEVYNAFELLEFHRFITHFPDIDSSFRESLREPALAAGGSLPRAK